MSWGGKREKAGRKPKADEQELVEKLTPLADNAYSALQTGLENNEPWAVKLWFEYYYGKPKQSIDIKSDGEQINLPPFMRANAKQS
jgi:hypothetical protein